MNIPVEYADQLIQFLLVFSRVTGTLTSAPIFGSKSIPIYTRIGFALMLSLFFLPTSIFGGNNQPSSLTMLVWWLMLELIYGLSAGFVAALFLQSVQMAGQLIDMQIGFGMVNVFDPQFGQQVPLIGNFKFLTALTVFLALQGHHIIIAAMAENFRAVPLGIQPLLGSSTEFVINAVSNMFVMALRISLPVMGTILMTDVALGILARIMPQMNIFVVGITGKIVVGLIMLFLIMPFYVLFLEVGFESIYRDFSRMLEILAKGQ